MNYANRAKSGYSPWYITDEPYAIESMLGFPVVLTMHYAASDVWAGEVYLDE